MAKLLRFKDNKKACWAVLELDSGEPCFISVAQTGVLVKKTRLFFGSVLYKETNVYKTVQTGMTLNTLFPENKLPSGFSSPVLMAFTNAAMHCHTAADVCLKFNEAANKAVSNPI